GDGGGDASQGLRHAGGGEDAGAGLPLSVPVACACGEERHRLPRDRGGLESDDLIPGRGRGRPPCPRARLRSAFAPLDGEGPRRLYRPSITPIPTPPYPRLPPPPPP